jgi:allophanate hydrolase
VSARKTLSAFAEALHAAAQTFSCEAPLFAIGFSLELAALAQAYADGSVTPLALIDLIYARLEQEPQPGLFISLVSHAQAQQAARELMERKARGEPLPLYGVPFAAKDNIDVAGLDTTAACPAFAYRPTRHAFVVERLLGAGALLIGKTNLDQFATGLVGVRSPYGVPANSFDRERVPGGSSSGSAVAVALGLCTFALGTDTAGSGRVPAAFNNVVGLKPTRGMLSTSGVVPACRSLDCVSVFALTVDDASQVAQCMAGFDPEDPYAQASARSWDPRPSELPSEFRFAAPRAQDLVISEPAARELFAAAIRCAGELGGSAQELELTAFHDAASLLYRGPFVAERLEAAASVLATQPDAIHPVVREILIGATGHSAADAFRAQAELGRLKRVCDAAFARFDCLIVPSSSLFPRIAEILAEPVRLNSELGRYTNFVNLLDLCALAIPAGVRTDGLPFGITLIAPRGRDAWLAGLGRRLHARLSRTLGATEYPVPAYAPVRAAPSADRIKLAVVGAHLSGQPLNHELTQLGARLLETTSTTASYRLFALATTPPKPGLLRVAADSGTRIELEVWELTHEALGRFMQGVRAPLCIGTVELASGEQVHGFLCEPVATAGAQEISDHGGWRKYRAAVS